MTIFVKNLELQALIYLGYKIFKNKISFMPLLQRLLQGFYGNLSFRFYHVYVDKHLDSLPTR